MIEQMRDNVTGGHMPHNPATFSRLAHQLLSGWTSQILPVRVAPGLYADHARILRLRDGQSTEYEVSLWDLQPELADLLRAGWLLQITPIPPAPGFYAPLAQLIWMRDRDDLERTIDGDGANFPICDLLSLWAFESEFEIAVRLFHRRVFPISKDGMSPAA
jgi:hypothetical protein